MFASNVKKVFPLTIYPTHTPKREKEPLSFWTTEIISTARKQDDYLLQWKNIEGHLFQDSLKQISFLCEGMLFNGR